MIDLNLIEAISCEDCLLHWLTAKLFVDRFQDSIQVSSDAFLEPFRFLVRQEWRLWGVELAGTFNFQIHLLVASISLILPRMLLDLGERRTRNIILPVSFLTYSAYSL